MCVKVIEILVYAEDIVGHVKNKKFFYGDTRFYRKNNSFCMKLE